MIRAIALTVTALLLAGAAAGAQTLAALEPGRPALRASATVTSDVVRIGDLIDNAGIVANIPIFRAPDPGTTGSVPAARVLDAVAAHALVGLSTGGIEAIRVTRIARTIAVRDIESQIAAALASQFSLGDESNVKIRFDHAVSAIHVNPSANGALQIQRAYFDDRSGRFDVIVEPAGDPDSRTRFSGTATVTAEVVTLNRPLTRGEVIRQSDITIERQPRNQVTSDTITAANQAVGRAVRNNYNAGRALRANDLAKPSLVQRNEVVTLIYEVPGITLTVRGKANEAGSEGDVVEVLNVQSKRTVHGVVTGPGRVVVSTLSASAVAVNDKAPLSNRAAVRAQ